MYEKEKIMKRKEELLLEKERNQKILIENKISNFSKTLTNFMFQKQKNLMFLCFRNINIYAINLTSKVLKIKRKHRFRKLLKAVHR